MATARPKVRRLLLVSRLDHDRPIFKVIDAGGGERIRTVSEELNATRGARSRAQVAASTCGSCGARKKVTVNGGRSRCSACLTDEGTIRSANKKLRALVQLKQDGLVQADATGSGYRSQVAAAESRIAERAKTNGFGRRGGARRTPARPSSGAADLRKAERAVEAARKERLLARTEFEVGITRERLKRAEQELARLQRQGRIRRSLR